MATETRDVSIVPALPFRYTFEEFEETHVILDRRRLRLASEPRDSSTQRARKFRYVISAVLLGGWIGLSEFGDELPGFLARRPGEDLVMKVFMPIILFYACFSIIAWINRDAKLRGRRITKTAADRRAGSPVVLYPVLFLIYVAAALFSSLVKGTMDTLLHDLTMITVPWIFIFVCSFLSSSKSRGRAGRVMRKAWDEAPHLHTEKRIGIDMRGFRLTDSQARFELDWERFEGEEGDNLIILIAGSIFFMVPKRVLSIEQIEFIRDRLGLRPAAARTGGFPVLPVNPG